MPRACRVCTHPQLRAINAAIRREASVRNIAYRFGLSRSSVARHAAAHLSAVRKGRPYVVTKNDEQPAAPECPTVTKTYRCPRFRNHHIGSEVVFKDGVFTTTNPHLQLLVEINPWFGHFIFLDGREHPL